MDKSNPYAAPTAAEVNDPNAIHDGSELASLGQRFAGYLIDSVLLALAIVPAGLGFYTMFPQFIEPSPYREFTDNTVMLFITILFFVGINGYLLKSRGQTFGKYLLATQILTEDDRIPNFTRVLLLRYVLIWVIVSAPFVGNLFHLANSLAVFRDNRKCLHDEFCKTKVVVYRPSPKSLKHQQSR